jgi:hypothetical protein
MGTEHTDKEAAGKALIEACKTLKSKDSISIGEYKGFDMVLSYDNFDKSFHLELKREMTYRTTLGSDPHGNITRVNNALDNLPKMLEGNKSQLEGLQSQLETAKSELGTPFPHEADLSAKITRLTELNVLLNVESGKVETDPEVATKPEAIAAEKPPAVVDKIADKPPIPTVTAPDERVSEKPPKSIYGKMAFYKERQTPPKETGERPAPTKSRKGEELS